MTTAYEHAVTLMLDSAEKAGRAEGALGVIIDTARVYLDTCPRDDQAGELRDGLRAVIRYADHALAANAPGWYRPAPDPDMVP